MSDEETGTGPCPRCGGPTDWEFDCPGWGKPVMVCSPPCGNAIRYECRDEDCAWWFRYPNKRTATGMGERPSWLDENFGVFEPEPPLTTTLTVRLVPTQQEPAT